jgi:hypothetical protein
MSREAAMQNFPKEAREIYQKYLKFTQGEAFLFGKGAFTENKYVWAPIGKDNYTTGEIIGEKGNLEVK